MAETRFRVVQVSDTHLGVGDDQAMNAFGEVVRAVNHDPPDLVVDSGDLVRWDPDDVDDRRLARALHDQFTAPVVAIPGNHDVGEAGWTPWDGPLVTPERLANFNELWGGDRFSVDLGAWRVIGIDALLLSGPLAGAESEQDAWLDHELDGPDHIALFVHKPILIDPDADPGMQVDSPARERLVDLLARRPVRLVASGHLHRHRITVNPRGGWLEVWAPSTVLVSDDGPAGSVGITGYMRYTLGAGGHVAAELAQP